MAHGTSPVPARSPGPAGEYKCAKCLRSFKTEGALSQHSLAAHPLSTLMPGDLSPPVDSDGEWVTRDMFVGKKSFGAYQCSRQAAGCQDHWISAHAQPKYTQACRVCKEDCLPALMWQNAERGEGRKKADASTKPHLSELCEACAAGDCTAGFAGGYF
jgi:hypothetical protein